MEVDFLAELQQYVGFAPAHAGALAALGPKVAPALPQIVDRFYEAVAQSPRALAVFTGGATQIAKHKQILHGWLEGLFSGQYDQAYLALRAQIGRSHVRIALDQRYMFAAMNLVREGLHEAVAARAAEVPLGHAAIDKICDLELAIMLEAYAEDSARALRDRERLATLGELSAFIAHELRNPLAVMETSLHLLHRRLPASAEAEGARRHLARIGEHLALSGNIITSLLELARDRPLERVAVGVEALVDAAIAGAPAPGEPPPDVQVAPDLPTAWLDATQVRQALVNLISNARQAVARQDDKRIAVAAERQADALVLRVDDSGPSVTDPLRTGLRERPSGRAGAPDLGLALCERVAEKHGGEVRALPSPLGGARFELRLAEAFPP